jgi:hypothetical protein
MSALTRSQILLPVIAALATSVPVFVVFQLPSMARPFVMTTRVVPLSRLTPTQAEDWRSMASPARSPSRMAPWSSSMVAVEVGPWMRWVRVLRAAYRSLVTVAVCRVRPLFTAYRLVSGSWFHSHCGPRAVPAKVSEPMSGFTGRAGSGSG